MPASVDPELARRLAAESLKVYSEGVAELLTIIGRRLAAGIEEPGWADAKLADMTRLRATMDARLATLEGRASAEASRALTQAYAAGAQSVTAEVGGDFARSSGRALDALLRDLVTGLKAPHEAILRTTLDRYRAVIGQATTLVNAGVDTRRKATQRALGQFAREGIKGFTDRAGRRWELETYAEMAVRTSSGRAAVAGALDRFTASGRDLVIVSNHSEECKICRPWEGKILSISGASVGQHLAGGARVAGSVAQAQAEGLQHPGCRHGLSAYVEGLTKIPTGTSDPEGDKQRQYQRALERQVRAAKRNTATQKAFVAQLKAEGNLTPEARAELERVRGVQRAATDRLETFISDNDRKRLRYREGTGPR